MTAVSNREAEASLAVIRERMKGVASPPSLSELLDGLPVKATIQKTKTGWSVQTFRNKDGGDRKMGRSGTLAGAIQALRPIDEPAPSTPMEASRADDSSTTADIVQDVFLRNARPRQSPASVLDWKTMPEGDDKRQVYMASREWALLKNQVRARSCGKCEVCHEKKARQVHHQRYDRLYVEQLADLLHVCSACHEYLSGK